MSKSVKQELYQQCNEIATSRIESIQKAVQSAQDAANSETKSTAGDKHDTSRAMMQLEVEQKSKQLAEANKLKQALSQFGPESGGETVGLGSLVITDAGNYYVSISVGKIDIGHDMYFAVSPVSPIASQMVGKKKGEKFDFNGRNISINDLI